MSEVDSAVRDESGEVLTPKGRLVYPNLLEAKSSRKFPDRAPQFGTVIMFPKASNLDAIKEEIDRAGTEVHGKTWRKKSGLHVCLKKTADNEKLAEFAEAFPLYLSATANEGFPPFLFGADTQPFKGDASDIYSGRWAVVSGSAWGSKTGAGNVGWNLNRVQLLDHDEPIAGGRVATASGFKKVTVAGKPVAASPGGGTGGEKAGADLPADSTDDLWA